MEPKTLKELHKIPCLMQLTGNTKLSYSNALEERLTFPTIEFEYREMLDKMEIAYREHLTVPNLLEYFSRETFDFISVEIPVYSEIKEHLFEEVGTKKMILPTKSTLSSAFDLERHVKLFRMLTFKYRHNQAILGSNIFQYTTEDVYYDIEYVWDDDDPIYCFFLGTNYADGHRYSVLFNRNKIAVGKELILTIPASLRPCFLGKDGKNIKAMEKALKVRHITVNTF
ncbi:MAG: hypothetical protein J6A04_03785 [Clostridia bacterium]|nr:hypothetical protein [Clostridia bacterium]